MSPKLLLPLFALAILLSACNSTVITEEDRKLPEKEDVMEEEMDKEPAEEQEEEEAKAMESVEVDYSKSFIAFTGKKGELSSHEGKFNDYTVDVEVTDGSISGFDVSIQIGSMVTDSDGLTKHLLNEDFFESETYPEASFVSSSVADGTVTGMLTIKGKTMEISFPAEITDEYMVATFDLDRTDFGVGAPPGGVKSIDAAVPMEIKLMFR